MPMTLSPEIEALVESLFQSGSFDSRAEVIDEALRLLQQRHELDDKLHSGIRQLEAGEFTTYEENEFDRFRADVMRVAETRKQRGNGLL